MPQSVKIILDYSSWKESRKKMSSFPLFTFDEYLKSDKKSFVVNFVVVSIEDVLNPEFKFLINDEKIVFIINTDNNHAMPELRRIFFELVNKNAKNPVIIKRNYDSIDSEDFKVYASTDFGALFIDGFGDGVWADYRNDEVKNRFELVNRVLFGVLQASRVRISQTEYIACPSCGRTLFDLVEVTEKIRKRTGHLKGVKIGIMGCIVNGPGEMADADYGYVGSGVGKITLYRGKDVVKRNVPSELAVDALIDLIDEDGKWIDPKE